MVNIVFAPCKLQVETTGNRGIQFFRLAGSEGGVGGEAHCQGHVPHSAFGSYEMEQNRELRQQSWLEVMHYVQDDSLRKCMPLWYCPF